MVLTWFPGWIGPRAHTWQFIVGVGMACAVTALPILVLFLEKLGVLRTPLGQRILRYASMDDVAIWGVLALILMDWNRVEGNWKQFKGQVKQKWGDLTDDDLDKIEGHRDQLEGIIQERYGIAKDQVRKDVDAWLESV